MCVEWTEIEPLTLVTVDMDPNNVVMPQNILPGNIELTLNSLRINSNAEELPEELSEEEVIVIDLNDNEVTVKVPKVKTCPYRCLGCSKLKQNCEQIRNNLIQDVGLNAKDRRWKVDPSPPQPSGIGIYKPILVNDDLEPFKSDREPVLVGASGKGTCPRCGNLGPLYGLCDDKDCIQVETKKVLEMTQGRFMPCNIFEQARIWEGKITGDKLTRFRSF
jgi:hypothetical protein